ncbi:predicted protein [Naegleria gruberi]|uniref:Predicted protein n=1 Tax=Naegleria gruberi TaxID=5762 RepID=D2VK40_NAEGR|nr:uncharacterized protein NAEGRDRAFT_69260 [Naegleria gruberi]EFC42880.1 predicted protein [Naegleria gruberi]|eukprot:XP_002675624.1 predicted protein [Naegleria gruberi strain NEG-M]
MGVCMSMEPLNENQIMACCPEQQTSETKEEEQHHSGITRKISRGESTIVETIPSTCAQENKIDHYEAHCIESIVSSESSDSVCIIDNHVDPSASSEGSSAKSSSKPYDGCKIIKKGAVIHNKSIPTIFIQFASHKRLSNSYFMDGDDENYLSPSEVC